MVFSKALWWLIQLVTFYSDNWKAGASKLSQTWAIQGHFAATRHGKWIKTART